MISFAIGTVVAFRSTNPEDWDDDLPVVNDAGQYVITNVSINEDGLEYSVNGDWGFSHSDLEFVSEATEDTLDYSIGIEVGTDSEDDDEGYGEDDEDEDYDSESSDDDEEEYED